MAPNNFEKQIQQKFNLRKIEPSTEAWDKLEAMLNKEEEKKKTPVFFWFKIAAIFLVFLGGGTVFFKNAEKEVIPATVNEVVQSKSVIHQNSNSEHSIENALENTSLVNKQLAIATSNSNNLARNSKIKPTDISVRKSKLETYLAISAVENELKNSNNQEKQLSESNNNVKEAQHTKINYNYVNPESLLAEVQGNKKVKATTASYTSTVKVNPNDLLQSVEKELDQSVKDKALIRFKQLKAVVVNRNYN